MLLEYWFLVSPVRSWEYTRGHRRALWTAETRSSLCFACFRARFATLFLPFLSFFLPFFFSTPKTRWKEILSFVRMRSEKAHRAYPAQNVSTNNCVDSIREWFRINRENWEERWNIVVTFVFFSSLLSFFLENFQILLYFVQRNKKSILVILELCRINLFDENRLFLSSIVSFALRNILNEFLREMKYRMETIFFLFLRFPIIHFFFLFFFSFFLRINSFNF